ncbi:hypothetical protein HAX54_022238 [Datura stramonium]|uniref:Uncharacterized protein n=1 Tax=Datura stramonium TaxID=4076 RepID=A0ABS8UWC0_DATST|nr:hypothetical protein [Datura stramonium]
MLVLDHAPSVELSNSYGYIGHSFDMPRKTLEVPPQGSTLGAAYCPHARGGVVGRHHSYPPYIYLKLKSLGDRTGHASARQSHCPLLDSSELQIRNQALTRNPQISLLARERAALTLIVARGRRQ